MRIARIKTAGQTRYAVVEQESYRLIDGDLFGSYAVTDNRVPMADARLLPPADPRQIVAIGANYKKHVEESGKDLPDHPLVFIKTPNTLVADGDPIVLPSMAPDEVDYEGELALIIGRTAKHVSEDEALNYVLGYTIANDVSARDCQLRIDLQWARGKSFDTFCPLGPWIETELEPQDLSIKTTVNDRVLQESTTGLMIFPVRMLISYLSRCMTLYPGSVILTGTPHGVGMARDPQVFLRDGDTVTVEIEGIGTLTNPVVAEK